MCAASSPTQKISVKLQGIHHSVSKQTLEFFFWSNHVSVSKIIYEPGDGEACVIFADEHAKKAFLEFAENVPLGINGHRISLKTDSPVEKKKSRGTIKIFQKMRSKPRASILNKPTVESHAVSEVVHSPAPMTTSEKGTGMHTPMSVLELFKDAQRLSDASLGLNTIHTSKPGLHTIQTSKPPVIQASVKPPASRVPEQSLIGKFTVSEPSSNKNITVVLQGIHPSVSKQALEFFFLSNCVNICSMKYKPGDGEACVGFTDEHARKAFLEFAEMVPLEIEGHRIHVSPLETDSAISELPMDVKSKNDQASLNSPVVSKKSSDTDNIFSADVVTSTENLFGPIHPAFQLQKAKDYKLQERPGRSRHRELWLSDTNPFLRAITRSQSGARQCQGDRPRSPIPNRFSRGEPGEKPLGDDQAGCTTISSSIGSSKYTELPDTNPFLQDIKRSRSREAGQYGGGRSRSPSQDRFSKGKHGEKLLEKEKTECTNISSSTCGKHSCRKASQCEDPCCPDKGEQCRNFEDQEAKMIRKTEQMLSEKALEEARRQFQTLAMSQDRGKALRQLLKPDGESAEEYYDVEDRVMKYLLSCNKWVPCITKIEKVVNVDLSERWLNARLKMKDPTRSALKFHETSTDATEGIIKEGFHMPKPSNQMYGAGIYFASDSSKSAQEIYTKGSKTILLCDVLLGKSFTAVSAKYDMTLSELNGLGYDSLFAKRGTKGTGVLYDEFVVYDPDQALPVYIIHFEQSAVDSVPNIRSLELQAMGQSGVTCHKIKPKRTVNMDDPLDVHFRIAESQILRLSQRIGKPMEITSVDYYINPPLVRKFEAKSKIMQTKYGNKDESQYILAFHGTRQDNIKSIVTDNFSLSKLVRGRFGAGIYFSEFPDVSRGYGQGNSLLLCRVLPGKSYDCQGPMQGAPLQHGYDSHRVNPDDSGHGRELVIFDPDQILPLYVINFK